MRSLFLIAHAVLAQLAAPSSPMDVSALSFGTPVVVAEVDAGKLKGELRRLAWSPDGSSLYLQSAEGRPPTEKVHRFVVTLADGRMTRVETEPDWAAQYWATKQDRVAPGLPSLVIEIDQKIESLSPTSSAGVLDRTSSPGSVAMNNPAPQSLANSAGASDQAHVVRLTLLGEEIAKWVGERPIPRARFGWGPPGSGALVFVGARGELVFLDRARRKRSMPDVQDAVLPAWSTDGARVAYVQKTGRKKYTIAWLAVTR